MKNSQWKWSIRDCTRDWKLPYYQMWYCTNEDLWYFEIQTDHLTLARKPDLMLVNKKKKKKKWENLPSRGFCRSGRPRKRNDGQIFGVCQRTKIAGEQEGDGDAICIWCTLDGPKSLGRKTGETKIWKQSSIVQIGQHTQKSWKLDWLVGWLGFMAFQPS